MILTSGETDIVERATRRRIQSFRYFRFKAEMFIFFQSRVIRLHIIIIIMEGCPKLTLLSPNMERINTNNIYR